MKDQPAWPSLLEGRVPMMPWYNGQRYNARCVPSDDAQAAQRAYTGLNKCDTTGGGAWSAQRTPGRAAVLKERYWDEGLL